MRTGLKIRIFGTQCMGWVLITSILFTDMAFAMQENPLGSSYQSKSTTHRRPPDGGGREDKTSQRFLINVHALRPHNDMSTGDVWAFLNEQDSSPHSDVWACLDEPQPSASAEGTKQNANQVRDIHARVAMPPVPPSSSVSGPSTIINVWDEDFQLAPMDVAKADQSDRAPASIVLPPARSPSPESLLGNNLIISQASDKNSSVVTVDQPLQSGASSLGEERELFMSADTPSASSSSTQPPEQSAAAVSSSSLQPPKQFVEGVSSSSPQPSEQHAAIHLIAKDLRDIVNAPQGPLEDLLMRFGIDPRTLDPLLLEKLKEMHSKETGTYAGLKWSNLTELLPKLWYWIFLKKGSVLPSLEEESSKERFFMSSGSMPLVSETDFKWGCFIRSFWEGFQGCIFDGIDIIIRILAWYQFANWLNYSPTLSCQKTKEPPSVFGIIQFYGDIEDNVMTSVFHYIFKSTSWVLPYLKFSIAVPILLGCFKGGLKAHEKKMSQQEIEEQIEKMNNTSSTSVVRHFLRWFILVVPECIFPKTNLSEDLKESMLWSADIDTPTLEQILNALKKRITHNPSWGAMCEMDLLASIAEAVNFSNLEKLALKKKQPPEDLGDVKLLSAQEALSAPPPLNFPTLLMRLKLKSEALDELKAIANKPFSEVDGIVAKGTHVVLRAYAHYLLWSIGESSLCTPLSGGFLILKVFLLNLQFSFFKGAWDSFREAEECPQKPGVTLAGVEPWANDLSESCFMAFTKLFNMFPGQPTDTLVGPLGQYYFPTCGLSLDLSGKNLDWNSLYNITSAMVAHNITLRLLNLSGNALGLGGNGTFPTIPGLEVLDISQNGIGAQDNVDPSITIRLAQWLGTLKTLKVFKASANAIGSNDNSTKAVGDALSQLIGLEELYLDQNQFGAGVTGPTFLANGFSKLTNLRIANLSYNFVAGAGVNNTKILAWGISHWKNLTKLFLAKNNIGSSDGFDSSATEALANAIAGLPNLDLLDLSSNQLGFFLNPAGLIALGNMIRKSLISILILANNGLGRVDYRNTSGTEAIGGAIGASPKLTDVNVENNFIGKWDNVNNAGTKAFFQGVGNSRGLVSFRFAGNLLSNNTGSRDALVGALTNLNLRFFSLVPQANLSGFMTQVNAALSHTAVPPLVLLSSLEDVTTYLGSLPASLTEINLSGQIDHPTPIAIQALMADLAQRSPTSLDLSQVGLGKDAAVMEAYAEGLAGLGSLRRLILDSNNIGFLDSTNTSSTIAFWKAVGRLALEYLSVANNEIGSNDIIDSSATVAFGNAVGGLKHLKVLNASSNRLSMWDHLNASGTMAVGDGIGASNINILNLARNYIGSSDDFNPNGTIAVVRGISRANLSSLDLTWSGFGYTANPTALIALGEALSNSTSLRVVSMAHSRIGFRDSENRLGTLGLIKGVGMLSKLEDLNLEGNYLQDTHSILALTSSLNGSLTLRCLNLGNNFIGRMGSDGTKALLSVLPNLPSLDVSQLNIAGMVNMSWTDEEESLRKLRSQDLLESCQASQCFGGSISASSSSSAGPVLRAQERQAVALNEESAEERQALALSQEETDGISLRKAPPSHVSGPDFPILTSAASSPPGSTAKWFIKQATQTVSDAWQMFKDASHNPQVQLASLTYVGMQLYPSVVTGLLSMTTMYGELTP